MTRNDFSLAFILTTLALFAIRPDAATLCALITASLFHIVVLLAPLAFDTKADALRADLARELAKSAGEIETLKNKVEMLTLGRAGGR